MWKCLRRYICTCPCSHTRHALRGVRVRRPPPPTAGGVAARSTPYGATRAACARGLRRASQAGWSMTATDMERPKRMQSARPWPSGLRTWCAPVTCGVSAPGLLPPPGGLPADRTKAATSASAAHATDTAAPSLRLPTQLLETTCITPCWASRWTCLKVGNSEAAPDEGPLEQRSEIRCDAVQTSEIRCDAV